ncbi:MAG: TrmB family transcriptional regulator [Vulcanimicrobiaceae bacterium]
MKASDMAIASLQALGFTEYESRIYTTLLRKSPLTGYEIAKNANIPRANVYPVLGRLVERGILLTVNGEGGPRYSAIDPEALVSRIGADYRRALDATSKSLAALKVQERSDLVCSARGISALLEHAKSALREAERYALVALFPAEARELNAELREAEARGVVITMLCLSGCAADCGYCLGHAYRYRVAEVDAARWLVAVADGDLLVSGQITGDDASVLYTRQPMLVELSGAYIRQSIAMASILTDLGPRIQDSLKPETRKILQAVSPLAERTFIDYMTEIMAQAS